MSGCPWSLDDTVQQERLSCFFRFDWVLSWRAILMRWGSFALCTCSPSCIVVYLSLQIPAKKLLCTRCLLSIAFCHGQVLDKSWYPLLLSLQVRLCLYFLPFFHFLCKLLKRTGNSQCVTSSFILQIYVSMFHDHASCDILQHIVYCIIHQNLLHHALQCTPLCAPHYVPLNLLHCSSHYAAHCAPLFVHRCMLQKAR